MMINKFGLRGWAISSVALAGAALMPLLSSQGSAQTAAPAAAAAPQAVNVNLNITPKRLVLDRTTRTGTVYIFNQGTSTATFDISLVDRVMMPNGEIKAVTEADANAELQPLVQRLSSAQGFIVAAPRRVTLAPGKGQTIRIRANAPTGTAPEYRTHLTVTTIPPRDTGVTAEQANAQRPEQLSFRITSVFGLSIPIIVRPATVDARGEIQNAAVTFADMSPDGVSPSARTAVLKFDLRRLGANSLFGNIEVRSGKEVLGLARGVGVYTEIDARSVQIPLRRAPKRGEALQILFNDDDASGGRAIARSTLTAT